MTELTKLKNQRKIIKAAITRIQNNVKDDDSVPELDARLLDLTERLKDYNNIQNQIESLQIVDAEHNESYWESENDKERTSVENQYYKTLGKIKGIIIKNSPATSNPSLTPNSTTINIHNDGNKLEANEHSVNLKPLPLPTFDGKHSEWFSFFDLFKSLVHNDGNISNIRKFHYLRSCLKDEALRSIESLAVRNENYSKAIETLQKRFENERLIVQEHITNILNIPSLLKSSHKELREIIDTVSNNVAALQVLNLPVDQWDAILVQIVFEKLDYASKKEWQSTLDKAVPTFLQFSEFLEKRCEILEAMDKLKTNNLPSNKPKSIISSPKQLNIRPQNIIQKRFNNSNVVSKFNCLLCKNSHALYQCNEFLSKSVIDRNIISQNLKLCANCLRNNHKTEDCKSTFSCKECNQRHHTLLHSNEFVPSANTLQRQTCNQVLLSTATVFILDKRGDFQTCRVLLDGGSQAHVITKGLCNKLGLTPTTGTKFISGISTCNNRTQGNVNVTIKSRVSEFATNFDCVVLSKITLPIPSVTFPKEIINLPPNVTLADPNYNVTQNVDLLIGAQLFWKLLLDGPILLDKNLPYLQNTKLGHILSGELITTIPAPSVSCNLVNCKPIFNYVFHQDEYKTNHLECEKHSVENATRMSSEQFVVKLPVKGLRLGESPPRAVKQFLNLENRPDKDHKLKSADKEFMLEYRGLNHTKLVPFNTLETPNSYCLPHRTVFEQADYVMVLGFYCSCVGDQRKYQINLSPISCPQTITKRYELSMVAKIFNALGEINPIIDKAKILLQILWPHKLNSDELIPVEIRDTFIKFIKTLQKLSNFETPRKVQNKISQYSASVGTKFHFIPSRSPDFGGLWGRVVRSVKHHLHRVVDNASLTYEEFYTLLTRIEACLNSRPLTPLSQDPNDLEALTPGDFLIGEPLTTPLERDVKEIPVNRLSRWQRVQQLQQHFWSRWTKEYLAQLQFRPKGHQMTQPNVDFGTLVVLVEDGLPPLLWRLGRVAEVHPGHDGIVRVVSVKTSTGVVKRAVTKVRIIPSEWRFLCCRLCFAN
ncbi:hypothetical protein Zmor_006375 [Zophobas morio]|uniref:DUF5641 domain-containing protein n=1 Tax=Zophobas morio TaxID=2755281 RepID=A0AA38IXA3_9CUCU|nr:hypothetical protein Zmor_006375 [Zophobas morio]